MQFMDMPMETVFDVLLDDEYRKKWDKFMQSMQSVGYINQTSDIFYYCSKFWLWYIALSIYNTCLTIISV